MDAKLESPRFNHKKNFQFLQDQYRKKKTDKYMKEIQNSAKMMKSVFFVAESL